MKPLAAATISPMSDTREAVSVILPVPDPSHPIVVEWQTYLKASGREWELLTPPPSAAGYGATLRAALETARHPLVLITASDYPYTPADLGRLLEKIDTPSEIPDPVSGEWRMRTPDLVLGCRTGVPVPPVPRLIGATYRGFCRVVLGMPLAPLPGWYGFREHLRAWWAKVVYGVPAHDPHCGFKLFRRTFLDRFPIQCDGDLVHIELVAKATFLTCLMDEVPLTPKPDRIPYARWSRPDRRTLFHRPKFRNPPEPPVNLRNISDCAVGQLVLIYRLNQ